jgi:hypothetical protein
MTSSRYCLQALGQDVGDKHLFVSSQRLPLPACGLISTFLSVVPRIRVVTLANAGIDDAGETRSTLLLPPCTWLFGHTLPTTDQR